MNHRSTKGANWNRHASFVAMHSESPGTVTIIGGLVVIAAVVLQSTERQRIPATSHALADGAIAG